jgi:hypothetical protein
MSTPTHPFNTHLPILSLQIPNDNLPRECVWCKCPVKHILYVAEVNNGMRNSLKTSATGPRGRHMLSSLCLDCTVKDVKTVVLQSSLVDGGPGTQQVYPLVFMTVTDEPRVFYYPRNMVVVMDFEQHHIL